MSEKQWFIPKVPKLSDTLRTYEQGVAAGRKEMAEAACKAQCRWCAGRVTYDNGWHSDTVIHLRCESELIRRAAKELGVAL